MTAADDWTKEIMTKGLPELEQLYAMLGAKGNVMAKAAGAVSAQLQLRQPGRDVQLVQQAPEAGLQGADRRRGLQPLSIAEMTVWDEQASASRLRATTYERSLLRCDHCRQPSGNWPS